MNRTLISIFLKLKVFCKEDSSIYLDFSAMKLFEHYHLQVKANPPKNGTKKPRNGIIPWHFSNSQLGLSRSLKSNDLRWWNFEAATSKFCNHSWNFGSSTQKGKVDLCMTNGSKVMVYLTLLNLLLHYLQEYSKIWNIAKSNKS